MTRARCGGNGRVPNFQEEMVTQLKIAEQRSRTDKKNDGDDEFDVEVTEDM